MSCAAPDPGCAVRPTRSPSATRTRRRRPRDARSRRATWWRAVAGDTHRRALRHPCAARRGLPVDGHRPARQRPDRSGPPHRARSDTAVVTTARDRRPRPAHLPSPNPTSFRTFVAGPGWADIASTTDRAAQLAPGSHQHAGRAGCDAGEPLGNREDTPCGGRNRPLTAAGQQRWSSPGSPRRVRTGSSSAGGHAPPRSASAKAVWVTRESR